jgi:hypothetical protein
MALINPHVNFNGNAEEAINESDDQYLSYSAAKIVVFTL